MKRFCKHGHDTLFYGRGKSGWCNECQHLFDLTPKRRAWKAANRRRHYLADREKVLRQVAAWDAAHPGHAKARGAASRARRSGVNYWALEAQASR